MEAAKSERKFAMQAIFSIHMVTELARPMLVIGVSIYSSQTLFGPMDIDEKEFFKKISTKIHILTNIQRSKSFSFRNNGN